MKRLTGLDPRLRRLAPPLFAAVVTGTLWEAGVFHRLLSARAYTLPYLSEIVISLTDNVDKVLRHASVTLLEASIGYALGSTAGYVLAVGFHRSGALRALLPVANGLNAMPIIALAPLMVLYFGTGVSSKVAVVILMTLAPMAVIAHKGLTSLPPASLDLLHSFAASERDVFFKLRLPSSLPYVFTALKLNVSLALIGAIIAEFFSSRGGIGFFMRGALVAFQMPLAWTTMVVAGLIGVAWYVLVSSLELRTIPWHPSVRRS